ncbi:hypothetical protein [Fundidesulfovibrio terrae]|uniref:hypothetical protein n=1 Tax=Fundidesulfovibrio terrae TaxID=2922866 RepID=UPI001FAF720C|nr:hypothetical protein [Fundidesulfovibrio terrae]
MTSPSEPPRIPDAIELNKVILEFMIARSHKRTAEIDAFVNGSNRTDMLVMEVFKGLIASAKA